MSGRAATRRGVVTTGTLSILIRAAENHPDENLRREIWRILKEMLEESRLDILVPMWNQLSKHEGTF